MTFLTVAPDDLGEFVDVGARQQVPCRLPSGPHPHIQRSILLVTEAARLFVYLCAADAEVQERPVQSDDRQLRRFGERSEIPLVQLDPVAETSESDPGALDRPRVAIEPDQSSGGRRGLEDRLGVTATAQSSVEVQAVRTWLQQTDRLRQENGFVFAPPVGAHALSRSRRRLTGNWSSRHRSPSQRPPRTCDRCPDPTSRSLPRRRRTAPPY